MFLQVKCVQQYLKRKLTSCKAQKCAHLDSNFVGRASRRPNRKLQEFAPTVNCKNLHLHPLCRIVCRGCKIILFLSSNIFNFSSTDIDTARIKKSRTTPQCTGTVVQNIIYVTKRLGIHQQHPCGFVDAYEFHLQADTHG